MLFDMENLVRITIRVHLISGTDHEKHIIYSEYFEDNFFTEGSESVFYTHPRNLLDQEFSIYVKGYCYIFILLEILVRHTSQFTVNEGSILILSQESHTAICMQSRYKILGFDSKQITQQSSLKASTLGAIGIVVRFTK